MLRQRIYSLPLGYEDLNDHDALRHDQALQTAADRDQPLASPSTLCRFENTADRQVAWAAHEVLMETFIASCKHPPDELVLDFDATDDAVHGHQEGRFFQAYYDHDCFLPLYVFCGNQLLVSYLRPSNIDGAKHARAILALLVRRLRQAWPKVRIILRGDSGFCRHRMLDWCDRHDVDYVLGIAKNARLNDLAEPWLDRSVRDFEASGEKQRLFGEFTYAAGTWRSERRVIARIEHSAKGANPRYIVTSLPGNAQALYEERYCARGEMENRIKEQTTRSLRRPHQLPQMVAQPVPLAALRSRLHPHGSHPPDRPHRHPHGPRPVRNHSPALVEDRRHHPAEHPPGPLYDVQCLPRRGPVPPRRQQAGPTLAGQNPGFTVQGNARGACGAGASACPQSAKRPAQPPNIPAERQALPGYAGNLCQRHHEKPN